jgi:F0F1-type ATP synthase membrane subunit b/b'
LDDNKTLGHLLQIESEAAVLVNEAQAEADRRLAEGEQRSRAAYEARYRAEAEKLEAEYKTEKEKIQARYTQELESYREELGSLEINTERFSACLDDLLAGASGAAPCGEM